MYLKDCDSFLDSLSWNRQLERANKYRNHMDCRIRSTGSMLKKSQATLNFGSVNNFFKKYDDAYTLSVIAGLFTFIEFFAILYPPQFEVSHKNLLSREYGDNEPHSAVQKPQSENIMSRESGRGLYQQVI